MISIPSNVLRLVSDPAYGLSSLMSHLHLKNCIFLLGEIFFKYQLGYISCKCCSYQQYSYHFFCILFSWQLLIFMCQFYFSLVLLILASSIWSSVIVYMNFKPCLILSYEYVSYSFLFSLLAYLLYIFVLFLSNGFLECTKCILT